MNHKEENYIETILRKNKSNKYSYKVDVYKCSVPDCNNQIYRKRSNNKSYMTDKCLTCSNRKEPFRHTFNKLRAKAKEKGRRVNLTYEEFFEFTKIKNCHYCNAEIDWQPYSKLSEAFNSYFLDRKNSNLGYSKENCVVCCKDCNYCKSNKFTYEEFMLLSPALIKIMEQRKCHQH